MAEHGEDVRTAVSKEEVWTIIDEPRTKNNLFKKLTGIENALIAILLTCLAILVLVTYLVVR